MSDKYKELKLLFISDPSSAINECQQIICSVSNFDSFSDFYNYHLKHLHISTCQNEWSKPQMAIHCIKCSNDFQSCFCLKCFLNSNHQGHDYIIRPNSTGNCDCGDLTLWKRSGFCKEHQGLEDDAHPEDYLDEKLRTTLTDVVFKAAFSSLKHLLNDDGHNLSIIYQFIISFLKFGDGFRRLVSISLTERINFEKLFYCIFEANLKFNQLFQKFCGLLVNDQLFKDNFSKVNFKMMIDKIIPIALESLASSSPNQTLEVWKSFWFHSYQIPQFKYNIEKVGWDWVKFELQLLTCTKELLSFIGNPNYNNSYPSFLSSILSTVPEFARIQPNEQTQQLFDQIYSQILTCGTKQGIEKGINDTVIVTSFHDSLVSNQFIPLYYFNFIFFGFLVSFKSKKNLKFDKMFEEMDKMIDISQIFFIGKNIVEQQKDNINENDQFISQFIKNEKNESEIKNENYFKSFHNGSSFFISHPMYYTLAYLMRIDNNCRIKIAKFLSMKKFNQLRIKLGIITLKNLLSYVCMSQSLIQIANVSAYQVLSIYVNDPLFADFGIPLLIPLLQLLIGIQANENEFELKEFFAFEMAREIGLFDNFSGENYNGQDINAIQKQMIFSVLYISILLVIERTLFNFSGYEFIKEQIIFNLKKGHSDLNELKDLFDRRLAQQGRYMQDFNEIVSKVAIARQRSKKGKSEKDGIDAAGNSDVSFDLKGSVECNNISAINPFNDEKVIMNDEISKHPENLIKIQNFEPEETYFFKKQDEEEIDSNGLSIKLKEFLMTPTVLAIVYQSLRKSNNEVGLNDHLAMNILILISKFIQEKESNSNAKYNEKTVIKYNSTVVDLITQLKAIVFNFNLEKNSLQNTLTKKTFNSFLKMKICPENQEPKSFVDLLIEKGPVGKTVLDQMSIETTLNGSSNLNQQEEINKKKKIRANKLKEDIINHYRSITANFDANDFQNDELTPTSSTNEKEAKEVCSICSIDKKDEILSYPLYIYKTKLPFILDKCPLVKMTALQALNETEVFEDDFDENENENEDLFQFNEILNEKIPSLDEIFAQILSQFPQYDITDDLSEEEIQSRRQILSRFENFARQKYDEMVHRREQVMIEKEKMLREKEEREKEMAEEKERKLINPDMLVEKQCQPGNAFVIQFGICQHLVHPNCLMNKDFTCPIDRSFKNGFLPNIDDLKIDSIFEGNVKYRKSSINSMNMSKQLKESLSLFIDRYSLFFTSYRSGKIVDLFVELVKSLSGLISTFEVRLRSLPGSLDSKKNKLLARNLFLIAWYSYRMKDKPKMTTGFESNVSEEIEKKMTVFQRFIKGLIECDTIEDSVNDKKKSLMNLTASLLKSFNKNDDKNKFLFLRRVCLAEYFLLMNNNEQKQDESDNKMIDWDDVLSIDHLSEKFSTQFSNKDIESKLRPFIFSKLPKEFLRFAQDPYNFPVDQTHQFIVYDILNYNELIQNFTNFEDDQKEFKPVNESEKLFCSNDDMNANTFVRFKFSKKNSPSVLLMIGSMSSNICVVDGKRLVSLRPFYLDRYGCTDIGYKRNQPLFLNEERYERVMDEILSGDFSDGLFAY